jgi:ribosomal-protein-serine acetyltransferase
VFSFKLTAIAELRILEERHAEEIYAAVDRNRARLRQWMPWLDASRGPDDVKTFIRDSLHQFANNDGFHAGIFVDGKFAGTIGFHGVNWLNRRTTLGYWIDEAFEGRGLMTAAVRTLTDHAIHAWKLNRVEIQAAVGNARSRAIPERLGFTLEGTLRQSGWLYDHFVDLVVYSVLAGEWVSSINSTGDPLNSGCWPQAAGPAAPLEAPR